MATFDPNVYEAYAKGAAFSDTTTLTISPNRPASPSTPRHLPQIEDIPPLPSPERALDPPPDPAAVK
jgi:hypothetical protein